jgi:hypothetical protein
MAPALRKRRLGPSSRSGSTHITGVLALVGREARVSPVRSGDRRIISPAMVHRVWFDWFETIRRL